MVAFRSTLGHCKRALEPEPGSGNSASAPWMADLMASFGIDSQVYSLDLEARRIAHDRVTFMAGAYKVDTRYTDVFGRNATCAVDSILVRV